MNVRYNTITKEKRGYSMAEFFPGSIIEKNKLSGREFLNGMFNGSKGLVMSQIRDFTGLNVTAIQNWINRGWLSHPTAKKYNIDQVARILIINMLRRTMSLEDISKLLFYINGVAGDKRDDVINESELYGYVCDMAFAESDKNDLDGLVDEVTENFAERRAGDTEKLKTTLKIIYFNTVAQKNISRAETLLEGIK